MLSLPSLTRRYCNRGALRIVKRAPLPAVQNRNCEHQLTSAPQPQKSRYCFICRQHLLTPTVFAGCQKNKKYSQTTTNNAETASVSAPAGGKSKMRSQSSPDSSPAQGKSRQPAFPATAAHSDTCPVRWVSAYSETHSKHLQIRCKYRFGCLPFLRRQFI